jgi:thiamine pyrophosphate-dependent acetolactate synthase large subunit-like protein
VVFLIINNGSYRILKLNMDRDRREAHIAAERPYPHMDLTQPAVDFVRIAGGFGVGAKRVNHPDELGAAVRAAFDAGGPYLLDVAVDGAV